MVENTYFMDDVHLFKVINNYKHGIIVVEVPQKHKEEKQFDDMLGHAEIIYNTNIDTNELKHIKMTNREYKKINMYNRYNNAIIQNYKFIFETITIDTVNEKYYQCKNYIKL